MAHAAARPLPTVLQTQDPAQRQSRVSFTSGESSIIHSGESSLQFVASTASSQSSNSSPVPLPKGARPPSPQPSFAREHGPPPCRKSSTSATWKLEWRGISKMVKWAFLGDKVSERRKPTQSVGPSSWTWTGSSTKHKTHGPRPYDLRMSGVDVDLTTSPLALSPENSNSRLDLMYEADRRVAQSEMGHAVDYPSCDNDLASAPYLLSQHGGPYPLEHASHVRSRSSPNVHYARTGRGLPAYVSAGEPQGTVSEVGHASLLHNSSSSSSVLRHNLSPSSRSDIGHGSAAMSNIHPSGMVSTSFLINGHHGVPFPAHSSNDYWSPRSFQDLQSSVTLPMNTGQHDDFKLTDRRNPRKLRKSIRNTTTQSDLGHGLSLTSLTVHTNSSNNKTFVNLQNTAPPPSSRSSMTITHPPRPPRKLTKKPSPQLPPIPNLRQSSMNDEPPPVPPKSRSILRNMDELPLPPLPSPPPPPPSIPIDSSDSSMPASTNTSHSSTLVDETAGNAKELDRSHLSTTGRPDRPSFLRTESNRRWTLAVADAPDDLFIEEFDRLRRMGLRVNEVMGINQKLSQQSLSLSMKASAENHVQVQVHNGGHNALVDQYKKRSSTLVEVHVAAEDEIEWTHARRAIMCCRELVRTERSYQARLQELFEGQVSDSVPKLLHQYLPALITASKVLSSHFNEDMSTTGVSRAIIQSEPVLEDAFLAWSGVVGEFFGGKREASLLPRHKRGTTVIEHVATTESHIVTDMGEELYRSKSRQTSEEVYVAPAVESAEGRPRRTMSTHWLLRPAFSQSPFDEDGSGTHFLGLRKSFKRSSGTGDEKKKRKPPFRELAILPTQRVTRYALLYKDLLKHTPLTSNSREIVEKAVRCAESLARKCDQAQGNTTFY